MKNELITILTKRKITRKQHIAIFEALEDIFEDSLLTAGSSPITSKQFFKIWDIVNKKK